MLEAKIRGVLGITKALGNADIHGLSETIRQNPALENLVKNLLQYHDQQEELLELKKEFSETEYTMRNMATKFLSEYTDRYGIERGIYFSFSGSRVSFLPEGVVGSVTKAEHHEKVGRLPATKKERRNAKPNDEPLWSIVQELTVPADAESVLSDVRSSRKDTYYRISDTPTRRDSEMTWTGNELLRHEFTLDDWNKVDWNKKFAETLNSKEFLLVPVFGKKSSVMGIYYFDNAFTGRPLEIPFDEYWEHLRVESSAALQPIKLYLKNKDKKEQLEELNAKLEKELEEKQDLYKLLVEKEKELATRKKTEAIDELLEDVAHAIRNPVASIGGLAKNLQRNFPRKDKRAEKLRRIVNDVAAVEKVLNDYDEYHTQNGIKAKPTDLNDMVDKVLGSYAQEISKRKVQVECDIKDPVYVMADEKKLGRALSRIVENALEGVDKNNPMIKVQTGRHRLQLNGEKEYGYFAIENSGHSVENGEVEMVFNPLFTTKSYAQDASKHFGFGLPIARRIIEEIHKGRIEYESSQEENYTRVISSIPLCGPENL
jgi:signal transduction histidine kinase